MLFIFLYVKKEDICLRECISADKSGEKHRPHPHIKLVLEAA